MLEFDRREAQIRRDARVIGLAYAGNGVGLNNPLMEPVHNIGPLPAGEYTLKKVLEPHLGPIVFQLIPSPTNNMYGRSDFYIHWDNQKHDFSASEGCIVPVTPGTFGLFVDGEKIQVV